VLDANPEYVRLTGHHDLSEIVGRSVIEWTADHEKEKNAAAVGECFKTGYIKNLEIDYVDSKGSFTPIEINATYMELEGVAQILTLCRDITDRKRAEEMLRESEEKYRGILENMDDAYYELDLNGNLVFFNEALTLKTGYSRVELMGMNYRQYISPETCKQVSRVFSEIYRTGQSVKLFDYEVIMQGGQKRNYESWANLLFDNNKKPIGFRGIARDITERKKAEERYRSIFENAQEGIFQSTDEGRFLTANRALATMLGYDSPEDLMTTVIDIPKQLYVNLEDRKVLLKMIEEQESVRGFEAQFYRKNGSMIWVSVDLQAVRDTGGRVLYYEGFNEDITIKRESIERMRKALGATVQAMAMTVETRDPYTAGHQRRVADLARSIATEMNLSVDQINGIRMAATIHDLGKISVPAEILSKPTKLTALEFSLIKTHPQSGYDILKDIDFPWPVARIVLEHHERMNGSGYPNGLTGDNILMESRIIAVADVVESMGSHRPYRPSLGIEAALEEIEKNRGTHYDNAVADACLRVFREKGYQLQ
jgi:PAS domain S-box-containing protein